MLDEAPERIGLPEAKLLLQLARRSLECSVRGEPLPQPDMNSLDPRLARPCGCFVTLFAGDRLRGCIGNVTPSRPLYAAVIDSAAGAAQRDPRFPVVTAAELDGIRIELSILSEPRVLEFRNPSELLSHLVPGRDGVLLRVGARGATFLPQVWGEIPGKIEFLERLCEKAGCDRSIWRGRDIAISTYEAECFDESLLSNAESRQSPL